MILQQNDPNVVNGPSIWQATKALESLKRSSNYNEKVATSLNVKINFVENTTTASQTLLFILSEKIFKRTNEQIEAVRLLNQYPNEAFDKLYDMLPQQSKEESKQDKANKFTKYLQRAEHLLVNDIIEILAKMITEKR